MREQHLLIDDGSHDTDRDFLALRRVNWVEWECQKCGHVREFYIEDISKKTCSCGGMMIEI